MTSVYITNRTDGTVTRCTADDITGVVGSCSAAVSGFTNPTSVVVSGSTAYVPNFGVNVLSQCAIDANGELTGCADSGVLNLNSPTDVAMSGTNAYIVNYGSSSVTQCTVDATTGALSACVDSGATGLTSPIGIATQGSVAYVINNGDKSVSQCSIDGTTGAFACSPAKKYFIAGLASPYGAAVNNGSLYIVNQGAALSLNPMEQSTVTRCGLDSTTGDVDTASCTTETGFTVPDALVTDWYQTNHIAFKGGFAYLTNRNLAKVTQCVVDPITGELSACVNAAAAFTGATGIAVK